MARSPSTKRKNLSKTTSSNAGGCFSLFFSPPLIAIFFIGALVLFSGETTIGEGTSFIYTRSSSNQISRVFTREVLFWEYDIVRWANEWVLDPNMVATIMQIESCGSPFVESHAGAIGLFQVMPYHFNTSDNPFAPDTNAARGLAYLRSALDKFNNPRLGLAGYNGGISNAGLPEWQWPSEMKRYTYWGFNIYNDTLAGKENSIYLDEWLDRGGANLCAQAREHLGLSQ